MLNSDDDDDTPVVLAAKGATKEKVTICHYDVDLDEYFQITISENGLNGHNGFGDEPRHEEDIFDSLVDTDGDGIGDCADCYPDDATQGEKTTWYQDADGDGLGNPEVSIESCFEQEGYVLNSDDDDDTPV